MVLSRFGAVCYAGDASAPREPLTRNGAVIRNMAPIPCEGSKMPTLGGSGRVKRQGIERRRKLAKRFGWRCWYCGDRIAVNEGHADHVIPKCRKGPDIESNLALTCSFCNMAKQDYSLDQFMQWLEWVRSGKSFSPYNMDMEAVKQAIRDELGDQNWAPRESQP